jgi:outer membrane receptor protein involved in Fe transport
MSMGKYPVWIIICLLFVIGIGVLIAGTTGKIAGRVVDKTTGEPLPGVNVIVKGTYLGAATDLDGYYVILHVPPGLQTVEASMIGYTTVTVNEVRIMIDQTAPLDIQMGSEIIETASIVVVADRNLVKKDVSTSVTAVQPNEIALLPVTSIDQVVGLMAGVDENLMVRGGSSDQLLFQIDGMTLRDPRNNKPISAVALSSIQEVSVERGGFNAEYGQVRSGIVNIVEKEGAISQYSGTLTMKYSPAQQKYFGISVYDPNSVWNRPYFDPDVCWTGTNNGSWDLYKQRQYPYFRGWNVISEELMMDDDPTNDLSPAGCQRQVQWTHRRRPVVEPDYNLDGSFGGPVPFISKQLGNLRFFASYRLEREMLLIPLSRDDYREYVGSLKFNADISNKTKMMLSTTMGKSYDVPINENDKQYWNTSFGINGVTYWNPTDFMRSPLEISAITNEQRASRIFTNSWYSKGEVSHFTLDAKLTSFISNLTYYEVALEHITRTYVTGPIGDRDLTKRYEIVPGYFVDEAPYGYDPAPLSDLSGMFYGGHSATARDTSKASSYLLKGDLTSQVTKEHLIKAGLEFSYYDLSMDYGAVNVFFGDVNYVKENWNPYRFSMYVQDKIEALGFIANLGLRLDVSNPNTSWANVDPFDESYFSSAYDPDADYPEKSADIDVTFSPRLGISHPITENSKLFFNYGHFKSMPTYEEIFRIGRGTSGNMRNYGDANLIQAKTISYELGYDHVLYDTYIIQLAAYYNDITDQQGFTSYLSDRKSIGYFKANNNNYRDIRGLEITLRKTYGNWIRGFANYTYLVMTQGAFGRQTVNEEPREQKEIDQNTPLLYQQKPIPQPRANLSLMFLTPADYGPEFIGLQPLASWDLNLLASWRAGEYITYPYQLVQPNEPNNVQVTDFYSCDLRINKTLDFKKLSVMLFVEVRNLFNLKRMSGESFYDIYDQEYYFRSLHLPKSNTYDNITGEDRIGDYRKQGVAYQPVEQSGNVQNMSAAEINPAVIYYDRSTKKYMNYVNGSWSEVEKGRMQKVLDDKAYIDMPNNSSFDFLNPRQFYYGITFTFKI